MSAALKTHEHESHPEVLSELNPKVHVPADLDRRLAQLAAEERTSKTALLLQGAELVLQRYARGHEIIEGRGFVESHDGKLLIRLEDG